MKKWRQLKYDVNDKDYQKGLEESKITAAAERFVRRDQNRMLLGAHGVRVLEACILDDTCKKRLAAFRRAAAAELPFPFTFQTEAVVSENTPLPNAVAVENVLRAFETDVVAILARAWNREGSGRLEAEKAAIELAEPLRTLRAELCAQRRGNKTDADALNDFRRAVREALREAQKFRKDWERTVGRREHELLSGGRGRLRRGALAGAALPGGLLSRPDGARAPARADVLEAGVGVQASDAPQPQTLGSLGQCTVRLQGRRRRRASRDGRRRAGADSLLRPRLLLRIRQRAQTGRDVPGAAARR
mmetsp:Transcript_9175/g.26807  ORF Transcript_9175/g.26807 Transcript_9175/m.26807 type:complete len:304 (-) Transcript_9175:3082-3993(-)